MNKLSMFIIAGAIAAPMTACGKKADAPAAAPAPAAVAKTEEAPVAPVEAAGAAAKPEVALTAEEVAKLKEEVAGAVAEAAAGVAAGEAVAEAAVEAVVEAVKGPVALNTVKFGGEGYDAEYNETMSSWKIEKYVADTDEADGPKTMIVRLYLDQWNVDEWPTDSTAFGEKLIVKDFLDSGSTWTADKTEAFDGGWIITGTSNDGEETEHAFAVRLDKLNALCRGYIQNEVAEADRAAVLTDAIEACKTAMIP